MKVKLKDLSYFLNDGFKLSESNPEFIEKDDNILLVSMTGTEIEVVDCSKLKKSTGYDYNSVEYGFFIKKEFCEGIK